MAQQSGPSGQRRTSQPSAHDPFATDNYYNLLNVPFGATRKEIVAAYRMSMKRSHPDRVAPEHRAQAEDIAKRLNQAYAVLTDPVRRKDYDKSIRVEALQNEIMNRYVAGFGGMGLGGSSTMQAHAPRRTPTQAELRERRQADRSALATMFSFFLVMVIGGIGLLVIFTLATWAIRTLI